MRAPLVVSSQSQGSARALSIDGIAIDARLADSTAGSNHAQALKRRVATTELIAKASAEPFSISHPNPPPPECV